MGIAAEAAPPPAPLGHCGRGAVAFHWVMAVLIVVVGVLEDVHGYLVYALFGLATLHPLAALWHHFVRHDSVLLRMWPGRRAQSGPSGAHRAAD